MDQNLKIYTTIINAIHSYYKGKNVKSMFTTGGCFLLASILHQYIPDSKIVFNQKQQHCACYFNNGVYDITGRISKKDFVYATPEHMAYMKKNFIPNFEMHALNLYLENIINQNISFPAPTSK